jgi:MFS superfamily sulfate permease-like transporter
MWPIYLSLAYYALVYLFLACAAYVCFSVVAGLNRLGKRLFRAILAFGGSALVGCIIAVAVALLHGGSKAMAEPNRFLLAIVYIASGLIGAFVSWRRNSRLPLDVAPD